MPESVFPAVARFCAEAGWPPPQVVASTASTNADLVGATGHGLVRIAVEQTAGRGRLDRQWISRPGEGLTFSVRLDVPPTVSAWGWLPLMAAVAVADAVRAAGAQGVGVKWPNDVIASRGKLAGILSVRDGAAAIIGIGVNLAFAGDRPDPGAVSVAELGGDPDPDRILAAVLAALHGWLERFVQAAGDAQRCGLAGAYADECRTLDRQVSVASGGETFEGFATAVDETGQLLVRIQDGGVRRVSAADVTLRA